MRRAFVAEKMNTYVRLTDYDPELVKYIRGFCFKNLARYKKVPIGNTGQSTYELDHVFATFLNDNKEFRLCEGFYELLKQHLISFQLVDKDKIVEKRIEALDGVKVKLKYRIKNFGPRNEEQLNYVNHMVKEDLPIAVNNASTGRGKALINSTLVQTPTGWKPIGSLKVGDEVIAKDGSVTKVTGVYPQGKIPVNRITFWDGRTADACNEHLWKVFDVSQRDKDKRWSVINTNEIKNRLGLSQPRLYIDLVTPYDGPSADLPIDPYVLGAFLGDGGFSTLYTCKLSNADEHVVNKVSERIKQYGVKLAKRGKIEYRVLTKDNFTGIKNKFNGLVRSLKLDLIKSEEKSIPEIYFSGNYKQRLELLQGLMDTDGYTGTTGSISYSTSSKQLALDVQKLVRSLGGIARISSRIPKYTSNGEKKEGLLAYRVNIRHPEPESIMTLPRRLERVSNQNQYSSKLKLRIKSVESIGEEECTCISVEHPDKLFVIDDYIVTHNTVMATIASVNIGERILVTCLPRYIPIWIKSFNKFLKLGPHDMINCANHKLEDVVKALKEGKINPKIILLPLTKMDIHIKKMREDPNVMHMDDVINGLGCGTRIIDEAHESIYSVYMSMMFGNIKKTFPLSATLLGDDDFVNKVYNNLFPKWAFLKKPDYDKYIHVIAYQHRMDVEKHRIRTQGFGGYSHVLMESSILRRPIAFENYYQVCHKAYKDYYLDNYIEGQKSMWFFATIDFCEKFNDRLLRDYPDLDSIVFTSKISKKKGMEMEYANHRNVVTTPGSCSTGKDIEYLYIVFACVAVSSMQRNDQMQGRTRPIHDWWPHLDPIFLYFVCPDIPKQIEYHKKRVNVLSKKTKKYSYVDSGMWV